MKLEERNLAFSFGGTAAVLWIICSASVVLMPGQMGMLTGHMLHANLQGFGWTLTWTGFFAGLIMWVLWAAVAGWLVGRCYNFMDRSGES